MRRLVALSIVVVPLMSQAFFDGFDGDKLGSNWKISNAGHQGQLHYVVANSLLKVNGLDGDPTGWSVVVVRTAVEPYGDFRFTALFGWDQGDRQSVTIGVGTYNDDFGNADLASVHLRKNLTDIQFYVYVDGIGTVNLPEPNSGMHEFTVTRGGSSGRAYVDGQLVASGETMKTYTVGAAGMYFGGPNDHVGFGALYVDSVEVVPEPAVLVVLAAGVARITVRRRLRR
jgi:hypothetical protein